MGQTPNRVIADIGKFEFQQTLALQAVSAGLNVADNDDWVNFSQSVKAFSPGTPGDRGMTEEFNASTSDPMSSYSARIPPWTPQITLYDTNGAVDDFDLTADINLHDDVFLPAWKNNITLPIRYSVRGTTGDPLYTYGSAKVVGITNPDITPGATESAVFIVRCHSVVRTEAVVA
ncbi:MAG: hypothetical protein OT477_14835 [Chloroflexi bacterium]|nr:hypothetical protein [Chloroflexota bacterium]